VTGLDAPSPRPGPTARNQASRRLCNRRDGAVVTLWRLRTVRPRVTVPPERSLPTPTQVRLIWTRVR